MNKEDFRNLVLDTLMDIGQNNPQISDEARNGMQVYANKLLGEIKEE